MKLDELYPVGSKERAVFFANFWSRVDIKGPDDCWEWKPALGPGDYGSVSLRGTGKQSDAHRMAYAFAMGEVPHGESVCHSCDNPPCCNPSHLWSGTQGDNVRDMVRKGRASAGGAREGGGRPRKLSDEQLIEMQERFTDPDTSCAELAREYGVSRMTVYRFMGSKQSVSKPTEFTLSET